MITTSKTRLRNGRSRPTCPSPLVQQVTPFPATGSAGSRPGGAPSGRTGSTQPVVAGPGSEVTDASVWPRSRAPAPRPRPPCRRRAAQIAAGSTNRRIHHGGEAGPRDAQFWRRVQQGQHRGPDRHVDDQPVITEAANGGRVVVLGLQPPDEPGRRVGECVDRLEATDEISQPGGGERLQRQGDVDLGHLPLGAGRHGPTLSRVALDPAERPSWAYERRGSPDSRVRRFPQATTATSAGEPVEPAANEFVIFSKPELGRLGDDDLAAVWDLFADSFRAYDVTVHRVKILTGPELEQAGAMQEHYGVINQISRLGRPALTDAAEQALQELYSDSLDDAEVLGGHQFLERYPEVSPFALAMLFSNSSVGRLGPGTYAGPVKIDGASIIILNGFHPRQLSFFTADDAVCAFLHGSSPTDWEVLRSDLIGATDPSKAAERLDQGHGCAPTRPPSGCPASTRTSTACTCRPAPWKASANSSGSSARCRVSWIGSSRGAPGRGSQQRRRDQIRRQSGHRSQRRTRHRL